MAGLITVATDTGLIMGPLITATDLMDMGTAGSMVMAGGAMTGGTAGGADTGTGIDGGDQIKPPPSGYSRISINSAAFRWA